MLTVKEREKLKALLTHAVKPEEAMTVDQLEGYLFGVVITPDVTQPSEWFTDIFGEAFASFDDEQEANDKFGHLMQAYNRLNSLRLKGTLGFPFNLADVDSEMLDRVRNWAIGLDRALALRSEIWAPDEVLDQEEISEEDEEILSCLMIVLGVAHPEQIPEIFENVSEMGRDEKEIWSDLVGSLPLAVKTLQDHALDLETDRLAGAPIVAAQKVGRNELCPCGSGRKYKKCCGLH